MMKEDTQPDGGLHWMMKEDQEYTEMEQGALSLVRTSTGGCFLYSQGKAPPALAIREGAPKGGPRFDSVRFGSIPESHGDSLWAREPLLSYCVGIFSHCALLRWHSTVW